MPASEAQIVANRINAAKSTGPRSAEGKERSRRNALKHGLAASVVVPGEEVGEVACRVALMQESLARDDDGLALILAERAGYLSMRLKRCYLHEEAMIARRVRDAEADYDDERQTAAEHVLSYIANEPPTGSRQLRATPEGVDLLIGWLEELRGEVDARWSESHCYKFDEATGHRSGMPPFSRVRALTNLATKGDATTLPPSEIDAVPASERTAWALAAIAREVEAELERLHAHRATLDHAQYAANRAQAGRRAVQGVDKATALARKYEAAAALAFDRTLKQIHAYRREQRRSPAEERAAVRAATDHDHADEARERLDGCDALPTDPATGARLGSFVPPPALGVGPIDASMLVIGRPATSPGVTPKTAPKPPRYTP